MLHIFAIHSFCHNSDISLIIPFCCCTITLPEPLPGDVGTSDPDPGIGPDPEPGNVPDPDPGIGPGIGPDPDPGIGPGLIELEPTQMQGLLGGDIGPDPIPDPGPPPIPDPELDPAARRVSDNIGKF